MTQAAVVQQDNPLLSLPAEIRNHIWALAVVEEDVIIFTQSGLWCPPPPVPMRLPGIVQASRQTCIEALPLYLDQNTFQFDRTRAVGEDDNRTGRRVFGPIFDHIEKTRRIQFKRWPDPFVYRVTREGDWSTAEVDYLRDRVISTNDFFADKTRDQMRKVLSDIMKINADGQLHQADFVTLVKLM